MSTRRIAKFILLSLCFALVFGLFSNEIKDPDFWWHLKTGEYICQTGSIPDSDPFAYTSLAKDPVKPDSKRIKFILSQYWLSQVIFHKVYAAADFQGIIHLRALIFTLMVFLIYRLLRREGRNMYVSLVLIVPVALILHTFTGERPQIFSFLLFTLLIFLIEGFRRKANGFSITPPYPPLGKGGTEEENLNESQTVSTNLNFPTNSTFNIQHPTLYLFPLPLIMLLWANLHGGFILGIAVLFSYLMVEWFKYFRGRSCKPMNRRFLIWFSAAGIASCLISFLNPNGANVIQVLAEFEGGPYKRMIVESMSPLFLFKSGFHDVYLIIYFFLLAATFLVLVLRLKQVDFVDLAITALVAVISLSSARYIPFFLPVSILFMARYGISSPHRLPAWSEEKFRSRIETPLAFILSIALIVTINNTDLFENGVRANKYPEGAAKFLAENRIAGNMFNPYIWGGYLMWDLYPDYKVFIDGRSLIEEIFFQEVKIMEASRANVAGQPEWKALLDAYNVSFIVTYSVGNFSGRLVPLIPALLGDPDWHLIYMDNISLIFVKSSEANNALISRFSMPKEWLWNEVAVEAALKAQDDVRRTNYYVTMGDAFYFKRNLKDARESYEKALKADPGNKEALKKLEYVKNLGVRD